MVARAGILKTELRDRIVESVVTLLRGGAEAGDWDDDSPGN